MHVLVSSIALNRVTPVAPTAVRPAAYRESLLRSRRSAEPRYEIVVPVIKQRAQDDTVAVSTNGNAVAVEAEIPSEAERPATSQS